MNRRKPTQAKFQTQHQTNSQACASAVLAVVCSLALAAPWLAAGNANGRKEPVQNSALAGLPATNLTSDQAIAHALNRLGYGPRPGDVERVKQIGLSHWIDQQLHPETIDDSAMGERLMRYPTLGMSSAEIEAEFPRPAVAAKRAGLTVQEYQKQQQEQMRAIAQSAGAGDDSQMAPAPSGNAGAATGATVDSAPPTNRRDAKRAGIPPDVMANLAQVHSPQRVTAELAMAKTDRAIYSERQLYEHMVDFWFNHFNVFAGKGTDRWLLTSYEREAIRPYAMGKFRYLLEATAKSPAMLFYLDNWQSVDPEAWKKLQEQPYLARFGRLGVLLPANARPNAKKQADRGLNENYGRELMELHTLGVDGGYTQQDVIAVARAFTGWTIRTPNRDPQFQFDVRLHDDKPKVVLGQTIHAGGIMDGEAVLDLLARDPHTAHHLSYEIAQEFVSDDPPPALVERMNQTYLATDGDIRSVLHTMIYSPEFWSPAAYRAKVKTPFELVVSAARALHANVQLGLALVQWTGRIGEPLYQCQPPNGYSNQAKDWVNTGALLNRLNYSLTLAAGRLNGASVDVAALISIPQVGAENAAAGPSSREAALDRAIAVLLSGEVSPQTRQALEKQMANPRMVTATFTDAPQMSEANDALIAGLVLGAPEFQRR